MTRLLITISALLMLTSGCAVQEIVIAEETQLVVAPSSIDEALLLDVGIVEFDPQIPEDNDVGKTGIYEDIRRAEAKYLPYHLKTTLQGTGNWGAVRVIPSAKAFTDIIVHGAIDKSDGEYVELEVVVSDAAGRHWFTRTYETQTGLSSYSKRRDRSRDPYQKVFNDLANDIYAHATAMEANQLTQIRQVSELQFFADMAPSVYNDYLSSDKDGVVSVVRLPAENDPSVARMRQIRERDRLVVDTLNEHYANFYYGIAIPYNSWRKTSRAETVKYRQEKRSAALQAVVGVVVLAGSTQIDTNGSSSRNTNNINRALQYQGITRGLNTVFGALQRNREAGLHLDAIAELSESFGNEAAPMVVNIEGQERRLTGTAEAQYESWRRLLKEIHEAETGFTSSVEVGAPARAPEPTS
ncbi:MAG: hypothetical protein OEW73_07025 [Gammaproteobacteria bacterium]|nr:hypothetical protein [Gammaproteobacteria bacterium]MDH5240518.1 hypothetical protein [Gammaproteobacteria bacterium]MDH5262443.1 hypothetical protein [Gammaproteobacteria bacterium]MDH5620500.1 hypothetical protein [Gammaproteobacteria bacterium]